MTFTALKLSKKSSQQHTHKPSYMHPIHILSNSKSIQCWQFVNTLYFNLKDFRFHCKMRGQELVNPQVTGYYRVLPHSTFGTQCSPYFLMPNGAHICSVPAVLALLPLSHINPDKQWTPHLSLSKKTHLQMQVL